MSAPARTPSHRRAPRSSRRGGTAIEFALILPFLIASMLAIFDLATFLSERQEVVHASWDAAVFLAKSGDEATDLAVETYVKASASQRGLNPDDFSVAVERTVEGEDSLATVTLTMPVRGLLGSLPLPESFSSSFTVTLLEG